MAARVYAGGALAAMASALAAAALSVPLLWLVPLTVAAIFLFYLLSLRRIEDERRNAQQMSDVHLATIKALVLAIDAQDQTTPNHNQRVQAYAGGLAKAMGMSETEVWAIETAALLHDVGKLAIPEHILTKPGPLSPEEFRKVRVHPEVGAAIVRSVPFPYPVAPSILSHHERWDGRGYPDGLSKDDIPLGARVICIADYFEALTSDRPYRSATSTDAAVALLKQESGKTLDPSIVDAFVDALPQLMAELEPIEPAGPILMRQLQTGEGLRTLGSRPAEDAGTSVFDDIALAHREIYGLYQIAQAMGTRLGLSDMMSLISSKLSHLVPFSSCALFLYSESTDQLRCRFATGTDSALLQRLVLPGGQGLNGWVARNRRPLVNARPSADLEAIGLDTPTVLQSALVCPLTLDGLVIGTLAMYHTDPGFYREDHRRLLDRVCEQAAAVIHNSIVFEQTQEDSLTDPLTRLPNTRSLFQHLTRELARASRLQIEVSVVVIDLDDFKVINDTYGHHVGDTALPAVSTVLRGAIRPYDMCVRYAGDEFVVVLTDCGRGQAESKRTELEVAVAGIALDAHQGGRLSLSISAGAAVFPHDGDTCEALLACADGRMYSNKRAHKTDAAARVADAAALPDVVDDTTTEPT
jgi:diguanylate cyclase (GGDEF)-like protein/putative nucleotidyltransferase with HDIG domain